MRNSRFAMSVTIALSLLVCHACSGKEKLSLDTKPAAPQAAKIEIKKEAVPAATSTPTPSNSLAMVNTGKANESYDGVNLSDTLGIQQKREAEYRLTGQVSAIRNSQIAFRIIGFISEIKVKPGTPAKKGDVLATLDDRDFVLRVALAKARRDQAQIAVTTAEKDFKREKQLKAEKASTDSVFDKMRAEYEQAQLSLKLAELDLDTAELALKDTRLLAPYDCVVAVQMKDEGENVPAGTAVFEVYDTAEPEITLSVPERLMNSTAVGAQVTIRMVPVILQKTRTFQITAKLLQYNSKIVPGSYAEATLN